MYNSIDRYKALISYIEKLSPHTRNGFRQLLEEFPEEGMAFKATDGSHSSKPDLGRLQDYSRETVRISTRKLSEEMRFVVMKPSLFELA